MAPDTSPSKLNVTGTLSVKLDESIERSWVAQQTLDLKVQCALSLVSTTQFFHWPWFSYCFKVIPSK